VALYAKIDCALDMNPKIRKAGRLGREVFMFLLRRNRLTDSHGILSAINIDPAYMAEQLMMPESDAVTGCHACVTAKLINVTPQNVVILGWSDDWAREAKTPAERKADQRRRDNETKLLDAEIETEMENVTKSHELKVTVTQEKKRKEKRREEKEREGECREGGLGSLRSPGTALAAPTLDAASASVSLSASLTTPARPTPPQEAPEGDPLAEPVRKPSKRAQPPAASSEVKSQALELWAEQDRLRQEAIPGSRPLKASKSQLARVEAAVLDYGVDDCRHVLAVYAAEARTNPASAEWFNGVSNWRTDNLDRARGRLIPTRAKDSRGNPVPPPRDIPNLTPKGLGFADKRSLSTEGTQGAGVAQIAVQRVSEKTEEAPF
jgi:hypothetical protein